MHRGYPVYTEGVQFTERMPGVHWRGTMMSVGDIMNTSGFHTSSIVLQMSFPHINHDVPQCTPDIPPVYSTPLVYCTDLMQVNDPRFAQRNIRVMAL